MSARQDRTNAGTHRGEAAIDAELKHYIDLFELAPIAYLSLGVDQVIRQVNRAAADLLGSDRERLLGAKFGSFVADHSRPALAAFLTQISAARITQSCEIDMSRENQPSVAVMLTATPGSGESECLVGMFDITNCRLEAEEASRKKEALFHNLTNMAPGFYWESDAEHRIMQRGLVSNRSGVRILPECGDFGLRPWELPYLSPDEAGWEEHRAALEAHRPFRDFEFCTRGIDGAEHHLLVSGDPAFDASGAFIGYRGLGRDITKRKLAERTLRQNEERYRTLFATASDGILILSRTGDILAANESFARMHGYSMQEIMNISLKDLDDPESLKLVPERIDRILSGEVLTVEVGHYHKDGHMFPVEVSASKISLGNEVHIQSLYRDITERKRAEAALSAANLAAESANLAKTCFLAAASHDLRQPVQAINLFLDALAQTSMSDQQKEISRYLGMSARVLRELLDALLDISQLESGAVKPNLAVIEVENVLRDTEAEFVSIAAKKDLRLRFFAGRGVPLVTDPSLLLRALRNIVGNAIKYTEQGGILIGARRRGARAVIQIWDTGIGIAPEHIGRIFEEYFQIHNRARDRTKGMGLGLSIVERLVKLIGGEISCRSRPGRGTVFEISLPLAHGPLKGDESPLLETAANPDAVDLSRATGRRVVVIEDDRLVAKGIEQALGALGATVASFRNAEEALASSATAAADLYISDFRLPGRLNGIELLDAIQRRSTNPINAVLMTGETASNKIELATRSNWKVLFKPIDLRALLSAM